MSIVAGQVTQINGKYIVICKDGSSKVLNLNDTIYEGEEIKAEGGSHLVISNGENDFVASVYANFMIVNGESVTPHCNDGCGDEIRVFEQESFDEVTVQTENITPIMTTQTNEYIATDSSTITYGGGGGGSVSSRYVEDTSNHGYTHAEASTVSGYTTHAQTITNSGDGSTFNIAQANAQSTTNITNIISDDVDDLQLIESIEDIIDQKFDEIYSDEVYSTEEIEVEDMLPSLESDDEINMSNLKEDDCQPSQEEQTIDKNQSCKNEIVTQDFDECSTILTDTNCIIEVDQY